MRCGVDPDNLVEQYRGIALTPQHGPDRLGDIGRDKAAGATWYKSGWKR